MKNILKSICLALIASFIIVSCGGNKSSNPKDVVNEYYSLLKNGKIEKALSYTTKSQEEIKQEVSKYEGFKFELKNYEILSEEIAEDGKTAKVKVKYSFTSTMTDKLEEEDHTVKLEKIDEAWKIKE
jgi:predicted 3-demethylubiquinone-9 3-methyltransferase (glyoxalase superfamily)